MMTGQRDLRPMKTLNCVFQSRPVTFPQNIRPHLDDEIGPQTDKILVERRMVQMAESDAVPNDRIALRLVIGNDMSRIQQFLVPQTAKCTLTPVCFEDPLSKLLLMQTHAHRRGDISSAAFSGFFSDRCLGSAKQSIQPQMLFIIYGDRKRRSRRPRIISNHKNRPGRDIAAGNNPVQID